MSHSVLAEPALKSLWRGEQGGERQRVGWLGEVVIESRLLGTAPVFGLAVTGQSCNHETFKLGLGAQLLGNVVSAHAGHANIQQHDVRPESVRYLQGFRVIDDGRTQR